MSTRAKFLSNLPDEILVQILYKLDVKSLGICMCVSKAWNFIIRSPHFVSSHLDSTDKNLFLVLTYRERVLHFDEQEFSKYTRLSEHLGCLIFASCNGLICLWDFDDNFCRRFILKNPTIRKSVTLPKPHFYNPYQILVGFGFDSIRNDYKILKLSKKDFLEKNVDVELYSLNSNSWKILAPRKCDLYRFDNDFAVFVNGVVHWISINDGDGHSRPKYFLSGFDMRDDSFKEIMLPESLSNAEHKKEIYVLPYGEFSSIAVVHLVSLHEFNIWVMKRYGMAETWVKKFRLALDVGSVKLPWVMGFRKNGGFILSSPVDPHVVTHDLESNEINNFVVWGNYFRVCSYMESLVLLDRVTDARSENGAMRVSN